mgnify:FL=1
MEQNTWGLGHYYRSCPRNRTQAHEKRLLEKELLYKLKPKEKEHQRKKILRIFFSWRNKQGDHNSKFWDWVRKLNPDNIKSDERFKSMSYEFLDKLMNKQVFRDAFLTWLEEFEPTLGDSEEDQKTKIFLNFIKNSIQVKQLIQQKKAHYLAKNPVEMPLVDTQDTHTLNFSQKQPVRPGLYFEAKCKTHYCKLYKSKEYVYIGVNRVFEYFPEVNRSVCRECSKFLSVVSIGFLECKWSFEGETQDSRLIQSSIELNNGYVNLDEVQFEAWNWLRFKACELTDQEKSFLEECLFGSFEDPSIPKKKYRKRKKDSRIDSASQVCFKKTEVSVQTPLNTLSDLDSEISELLKQESTYRVRLSQLKKLWKFKAI